MPTAATAAKVGNTIIATLITYNDQDVQTNADAPGPTITIRKKLPNGATTEVVSPTTLSPVGTGEYRYDWDSTSESPGDYVIIWEGSVGGLYFYEERDFTLLTPAR